MEDNIIVRILSLPSCVRGVTVVSPDDIYNVYINGVFNMEEQKKILNHELTHIKNSDFQNFDTIKCIENRAKSCPQKLRKIISRYRGNSGRVRQHRA